MKIRFVSHASFSVESEDTTLLCDPWLFGKAFNRGWALLSPAAPVSWQKVNYVWISHQHPDHLHFPTLKSVDPQQRKRLTMLYQKHASARVPKVLRGLGYPSGQELKLNSWVSLRKGFDVMCGSAGSMDSWLAVHTGNVTILNLNDCMIEPRQLAYIRRLVGKVNVLLTQFSFANWIGNHADERREVEKKLQEFRERAVFFAPEVTIPFASFIYFCSQENSWMNEFAITPKQIASLGLPGISFMYPGDVWDSDLRASHSVEAIERYARDMARPKTIDPTPQPVSNATLQQTVDRTLRHLRSRFGGFLISRIKPFSIYLHDVDKVLFVYPAEVCAVRDATNETRGATRYIMCSQVAWYAFAYCWGWGAMELSGMYLDRRWQTSNPLAFYLNIVSTEFLNFGGLRESKRTFAFLWAKRHELSNRFLARIGPRKPSTTQDLGQPGAAIPSSRTA
ncbi:MAG: MBL fold metallo-hydrolase [Candidatus Sulfotelmatobacter sp.]